MILNKLELLTIYSVTIYVVRIDVKSIIYLERGTKNVKKSYNSMDFINFSFTIWV